MARPDTQWRGDCHFDYTSQRIWHVCSWSQTAWSGISCSLLSLHMHRSRDEGCLKRVKRDRYRNSPSTWIFSLWEVLNMRIERNWGWASPHYRDSKDSCPLFCSRVGICAVPFLLPFFPFCSLGAIRRSDYVHSKSPIPLAPFINFATSGRRMTKTCRVVVHSTSFLWCFWSQEAFVVPIRCQEHMLSLFFSAGGAIPLS